MTITGLMDCTLREGTYEIALDLSDVSRLATDLFESGVRYIEAGVVGARGSRIDIESAECVRAAVQAVPQAAIGVFAVALNASFDGVRRAVDAGAQFVRVGANVTEVDDALPMVAAIKALGVTVALNAMKSYALPDREVIDAALAACSAGADIFYLVDSAGCMLPQAVRRLVDALCALGVRTGFHGHDNLSLSVANSLAALEAGAAAVDGTLRGVGRSAGNAQIEVLVKAAQKLGYLPDVDGDQLAVSAERLIAGRRPRDRGVSCLDLVMGEGQFHSDLAAIVCEVAESWDVSLYDLIREVGRRDMIDPSRSFMESVALELRGTRDAMTHLRPDVVQRA